MHNIQLGKYIHSKSGKYYQVIAVGKHSETLEDVVIYQCLYDNPTSKIWVRPLTMFQEEIEVKGKKVPRFLFISA